MAMQSFANVGGFVMISGLHKLNDFRLFESFCLDEETSMARVFAGNLALVDQDVLESVKRLPHEFFAFAEFDIDRRNIDWLIIRASDGGQDDSPFSAAILTELKRVSAPITGTVQDEWKVERIDGTIESVSGGQEKNPYWQAVSAANALRNWLWNHHKLFCDEHGDSATRQESNFSVWPDVLILPRHDRPIDHRLPVRPTNGFGMWWFELDRWAQHVLTWRPNQRDRTRRFTESELIKLAELFNTHQIYDSRTESPREVITERPAISISSLDHVFSSLTNYLRDLEDQISSLTSRVWQLEQRSLEEDRADLPALPLADIEPPPVTEPPSTNGNGPHLPEDQAVVLAETAHAFALAGRRAVFPAVLKDVERRLGYSLKQSEYHGFGSARSYFDQARAQGVIRFGPEDENGSPTI